MHCMRCDIFIPWRTGLDNNLLLASVQKPQNLKPQSETTLQICTVMHMYILYIYHTYNKVLYEEFNCTIGQIHNIKIHTPFYL